MSKSGQEEVSPVHFSLEKEFREERLKRVEVEAEKEVLKRELEKVRGEIYRIKKKSGIESTQKEPEPQARPVQAAPVAPESVVRSPSGQIEPQKAETQKHTQLPEGWEAPFCLGCGGNKPNPNFKDEARCKKCNFPYGKEELAQKTPYCPLCGDSEYVKVKR